MCPLLSLDSGEQTMIASLQEGKPVIIDTLRHYFFADGYNNGLAILLLR